jgi:hypothetical protein
VFIRDLITNNNGVFMHNLILLSALLMGGSAVASDKPNKAKQAIKEIENVQNEVRLTVSSKDGTKINKQLDNVKKLIGDKHEKN